MSFRIAHFDSKRISCAPKHFLIYFSRIQASTCVSYEERMGQLTKT